MSSTSASSEGLEQPPSLTSSTPVSSEELEQPPCPAASPKFADLGWYIGKVYYGGKAMPGDDIFARGLSHNSPPRLRSDRMNRIIVYAGCFNPPHVGHQALLTYVFNHCKDINVVAAVIIPADDDAVKEKLVEIDLGNMALAARTPASSSSSKPPSLNPPSDALFLTKEQRIALWFGGKYNRHEWY